MALSKATLTAVLALAFTVLSAHAAAPMSAPAPAPTAGIFETGCGFEIYLAMRVFTGDGYRVAQ
ncbi:hypothetical protein OIU78_002086 [Salix suchowensis]|uniref:Uncharacterized protein n=1 Tax=Salix purpurea TaxID=77065 RepID=A0A9Q0Q1Q5_SALPP|nr:hypothetical protein OIU78_002086 [Salix suchowensis]KAJ6698084.1 hypothetical protein OIU79_011592 [Salix purpurea]